MPQSESLSSIITALDDIIAKLMRLSTQLARIEKRREAAAKKQKP